MKTKDLILTTLTTISLLIVVTSTQSTTNHYDFKKKIELTKKNSEIVTPTPMFMYEAIEKYSEQYEIPRYIAYNISFLETRYRGPFHWTYNPVQTSCAGALGPMQIMPGTAKLIQKRVVPKNVLKTDIMLNVEISMKLLRKLFNKYHDWSIVCGCYNTGHPLVNDYARFCVKNKNYQNNWVIPNNI